MAHSLSDFKSTLTGGGARPNLFQVTLTFPPTITKSTDFDKELKMLCKAANLPASNIANIDVPFRGRIFKVAGDRTFDTWQITVINDNDFAIRKVMEDWMQHIAQYKDASGTTDPATYMANATVTQLSRSASTITASSTSGVADAKQYIFEDIFPTNISAIDLSFDTSDTIEEFTVEFQVNYWYPAEKTN